MSAPTLYQPYAHFVKQANLRGLEDYQAISQWAQENSADFWAFQANRLLSWQRPFATALNDSQAPFFKWFEEGQLNASFNCLDRHVLAGRGGKTALIFEADNGQVKKLTYTQLLAKTCQIANALKQLGVEKGDRVIIYLSVSIEAIASMLACARIGAIHSVIFGGFSTTSVYDRIVDMQAKLIITADVQMRGGKPTKLKAIVDEALLLGPCPSVKHVLTVERTSDTTSYQAGRDVTFKEWVEPQKDQCDPVWVDSEHPLFLLYTSGSTGKPKGIQHATAGYLLHAALTTDWTFDYKPSDIIWTTADIGWITGHTYALYGPLCLGSTQMIFEGIPTYPHSGRFWEIIQRHKVSVFYTAPTAIRSLIKLNESNLDEHPKNYDLSSLRLIACAGEPINPAAWEWFYQHVGGGRCPLLDTFWQTETGGQVLTPLPGVTPLVAGSCTLPFPGIDACVVDETGAEVPHGVAGLLVIKKPWPALARTIWGDAERYKNSYFPDNLGGTYYLAGDGAVRDPATGYFTITGRIDDVLNVSGHRMGTMEVESALVSCTDWVAEAAVVGRPDETTGEAICAFVVLKGARPEPQEAERIAKLLRDHVGKMIGPIAKPKDIRFGDNLPKTRSGKIMRRLLRSIAREEPITQDISTLENPAILQQFQTLRT